MNLAKNGREVFKISDNKKNVICPPEQVFQNSGFEYLVTLGGNLVDNDEEYQKLMVILKNIGEAEYYIIENLGATLTERTNPFAANISVDSSFKDFLAKVENFSAFENDDASIFNFYINHFYIFGGSHKWGIYICEYPTINIIGCVMELKDKFKEVYKIERNGFDEIKEFLEKEFQSKPYLLQELIDNYKLRN